MKVNNRGFAITVMLYSVLAIITMVMVLILSTMSGSKKNNSDLIDHIKDDLNNATYDKTETYTYTGTPQEFTVIKEGYYKIELWGASGSQGATIVTNPAGKGAYTSGVIYLKAGQKLYFYVGQQGQAGCDPYTACTTLTYNGGGLGGYFAGAYRYASGGGATDVRLESGNWDDQNSLKSRIMVAAGGGSGDNINTGSHGGTLIGEAGDPKTSGAVAGGGGTQTSGGSSGENPGGFGYGGNGHIPYATLVNCNDAFGGGGGYYGGGGGVSGNPSQTPSIGGLCAIRGYPGGGSSFISGYAGVNAVASSNGVVHSNNTLHYSGKYFQNGRMVAATNEGDGKAVIRYVGNENKKITDKLNNVRYIKDCTNGNSVNAYNHWVELQAVQNGINIAKEKITTNDAGTTVSKVTDGDISSNQFYDGGSNKCIIVDLQEARDLDEIAVWHYYSDKRSYYSHTLSVSSDKTNWVDLITNEDTMETANGIRFSAYQ